MHRKRQGLTMIYRLQADQTNDRSVGGRQHAGDIEIDRLNRLLRDDGSVLDYEFVLRIGVRFFER
jgi:hypothetical protein